MSVVSQLLDMRCVLGITAASKGQRSDGTIFVQVQMDVVTKDPARDVDAPAPPVETVTLELTLPQFYNMLSEFEEAKAALRTVADR